MRSASAPVRPVVLVALLVASPLPVLPGCGTGNPAGLLPPPPQLLSTSFDDGAAVRPTATVRLRFSAPLDAVTADERALLLVRGTVSEDEQRALERGEPELELRNRLAPLAIAVEGAGVTLDPRRPLDGSTRYTLVVTTWLRAGGRRVTVPLQRGLRTRGSEEGAPWATLISPASGAPSVVRNLREVTVELNRPALGVDQTTLQLLDETDEVVAARVLAAEPLPARRYRVFLSAPLRALRRYRLRLGDAVTDEEGQAPFHPNPPPGFRAGLEIQETAPTLSALDATASSGCLVARFSTSRPAATRLCVNDTCVEQPELRVLHQLEVPLAGGTSPPMLLAARDESTAPEGSLGPMAAPPSSPRPLAITEVHSHPVDGSLSGQFVELRNLGPSAVSTDGLELADERGASMLPAATLEPGAYALVVPSGFPEGGARGADPGSRPLPGTVILRVASTHLGGNGIRQSGEAITLRERDGRLVSRFSTEGLKLQAGQSARRVAACDRDGAWESTPGGTSTPGGP